MKGRRRRLDKRFFDEVQQLHVEACNCIGMLLQRRGEFDPESILRTGMYLGSVHLLIDFTKQLLDEGEEEEPRGD